ncbi:hypothetical protein [Pedobacter sp. SYP-B3415]|uniref:hypothetical protein n=1 Tax=Pedobacter sp. SYP-B3415 TaxID=2496641 RepID=UPI00101CCEA3|nr:hypothetical protein [Pedobacter sp. SYP-B3415]
MADFRKTILLELGLRKEDFVKEAAETQKQVSELIARQKELKAAGQEATIEYQNNAANLKLLKSEYAEAQRNAANFEKAVQAGGAGEFGSLAQLKAELSVLTSKYGELADAGREYSEEGQDIARETARVTAELKKAEEKVLNFRRNVGNYPEPIKPIPKDTVFSVEKFNEILAQVPHTVVDITTKIKNLEQLRLSTPINQVGELNDAVLQLNTDMQKALGKIDEFGDKEPKNNIKKSYDDLNDAIQGTIAAVSVANFLGADEAEMEKAIAAAVTLNTVATNAKSIAKGAVVAWEKAEMIATQANIGVQLAYGLAVGKSTGSLKLFRLALAGTGIGAIVILIGMLIANFDSVKNAVTGFIDRSTVLKTVINYLLLPMRLLWQGLKMVGEYFGFVDSQARKAADAMYDAVARTNEGLQYRIDLLNAQGNKEKEVHELVLKQIDNELNARRKQIDAGKVLNEEEQKSFRELKAKRMVEEAKFNKWSNEEAAKARDKADSEAEKAKQKREADGKKASDAAKKVAEERKRQLEEELAYTKELTGQLAELDKKRMSSFDSEIAEADRKYKEQVAKAKGNKAQLKLIDEIFVQEIAGINRRAAADAKAQQDELDKQRLEQALETVADNAQRHYELKMALIEKEREMELAQLDLTETQRQALQEKYRFQQQQAESTFAQTIRSEREAHAQAYVDREKQMAEAKEQFEQRKIDSISRGLSIVQGTFNQQTVLYKLAFALEKGLAVASIALQTQKALSANRVAEQLQNATLSAVPFVGPALALANSMKARGERFGIILEGALGVASIAATVLKGFNRGGIHTGDGMVYGPGTGTSDSINARLSNGESVINARSTRMFGPILSAMNVAGGGRAFSAPVSYYMPAMAEGGVYSSLVSPVPQYDPKEMGEAVAQALVQNFPQIWVNVADVTDAQAKQVNVDERVSY